MYVHKTFASTKHWHGIGGAHETKITTRKIDVRVIADVNHWIEDTFTEFGRLDGAANVAGVAGGDGDTTVETIVRRV